MSVTLLYHDIAIPGMEDTTGFPGPGAARYKLPPDVFERHLDAFATVQAAPTLTFDDGGVSSMEIADSLEKRGLRGTFLIATDYIGKAAFLSPGQVRELQTRGHVIGSHSCSHPERMSALSWREILSQWSNSRQTLADIGGADINVASVPNGYCSADVMRAADRAGYRLLYTSEPTLRAELVGLCRVVGRFMVQRGDSAAALAAVAAGRRRALAQRAVTWRARKMIKVVLGEHYITLRKKLLRIVK